MKRILLALILLFAVQEVVAQCNYLPSNLYVRRRQETGILYSQVCLNTTEHFSVDGGNSQPIYNLDYTYTVTGGVVVSNDGPSVQLRWTSLGSQSFTVTATNNCGESRTKTVSVFVENTNPTSVSFTAPSTGCVGVRQYFPATSNSGRNVYKWRVEALDGGSVPYISGTSSGSVQWERTGVFRIFCTSFNGCGDGPTVSKDITVLETPVAPTSFAGPSSMCIGSTGTYSITPKTGETYTWTITGGTIVSNVNQYTKKIKWSTAGWGRVNVVANTASCGSSPAGLYSVRVDDGVPPANIRVYQYNGVEACSSNNANKGYYVIDNITVKNWRLSGGGVITSSSTEDVYVNWTASGEHTLYGTPYNACGNGPDIAYKVYVDGTLEPNNPAGPITGHDIRATSIQLRWDDLFGMGEKQLVVIRKNDGTVSNRLPQDGTAYVGDKVYGQGDVTGPGNYVVWSANYGGSRTYLSITGLEPCTRYKATVYEYNENTVCSTGGYSHNYLTSNVQTYTWETDGATYDSPEPTQNSSSVVTSSVSPSSIGLSWTKGNGGRRLVIARKNAVVNKAPADRNSYTASSYFGSGHHFGDGNYVVYNGSGNAFTMTGLDAYTWYYFKIFEYNVSNCMPGINYMSSGATKGQRTDEEIIYPDKPCNYYSVYTGDGTEDQMIIMPIEPCLYGADPGNIQPSTVTMEADHSLHIQLSQVTGSASEVEVYDMMGNLLLRDTMAPGETDKRVAMELGREHALLIVRVKHQYGVDAHKIAVR